MWDMWNVCLQTFRTNRICQKLGFFLRNLQTSQSNNSRIPKIEKAKFSGYCFYMNTTILADFHLKNKFTVQHESATNSVFLPVSVFFDKMLKICQVKLGGEMIGRWWR